MTTEPNDESMSETSRAVLRALRTATTLAKPILNAQSALLGYDPNALEPRHLESLVPKLIEAVGRFGSAAKVRALRAALLSTCALYVEETSEAQKEEPSSGYRRVGGSHSKALSAFAQAVQSALVAHSPLGWSLLEAQCERRGQKAAELRPESLSDLMPEFQRSLRRFGSSDDVQAARIALERLIRRAG